VLIALGRGGEVKTRICEKGFVNNGIIKFLFEQFEIILRIYWDERINKILMSVLFSECDIRVGVAKNTHAQRFSQERGSI